MLHIKLFYSFIFMMLQCCIMQIQAGVRQEFNANEVKNFKRIFTGSDQKKLTHIITPNDFKGTDSERIQSAINAAKGTTNKVVIPMQNAKGANIWKIDKAILLPSNMTLILDNCIIQLSDLCRDNMFRSDNVGAGITNPGWNFNITIAGIGDVQLIGADNPRSTGDAYRTLTLTNEKGRVSYGSDAGKEGNKQKGDWRNNMIQIANVDGFKLKNITIKNSHAWAISFERTRNVELSALRFMNPEYIKVNGTEVKTYNKDGINLRHGCKYFRIDNITGINGDDLIALSSLDAAPYYHTSGDINSYQVTSTKWNGPEDDTEQVFITNCQTNYTGVAIRASDNASIHHVYINGVITKARPDTPPPYGGSPYTVLVGGRGYGDNSVRGKINNIYAINLFGDGKSLILVESQVSDCQFINGIYTGSAPDAITYNVDKKTTTNITEVNLIKVPNSPK